MSNKVVVVKLGGSTLGSHDSSLKDLVHLQRQGVAIVVVHGGGKVVSLWMEKLGMKPRFVKGLRVTDRASIEVVTAVLAGLVNKELVARIQSLGGKSLGISGVDGGIIQARAEDPELGLVGEPVSVNPELLTSLLEEGYMPLLASIGINVNGASNAESSMLLNLNADTVAGEVARSLKAQCLVLLTDVAGVQDSAGETLPHLTSTKMEALLYQTVLTDGMIPKAKACLRALEAVPQAYILDGREPGALHSLLEGHSIGTLIERG